MSVFAFAPVPAAAAAAGCATGDAKALLCWSQNSCSNEQGAKAASGPGYQNQAVDTRQDRVQCET
jgi:hypothetical protein